MHKEFETYRKNNPMEMAIKLNLQVPGIGIWNIEKRIMAFDKMVEAATADTGLTYDEVVRTLYSLMNINKDFDKAARTAISHASSIYPLGVSEKTYNIIQMMAEEAGMPSSPVRG